MAASFLPLLASALAESMASVPLSNLPPLRLPQDTSSMSPKASWTVPCGLCMSSRYVDLCSGARLVFGEEGVRRQDGHDELLEIEVGLLERRVYRSHGCIVDLVERRATHESEPLPRQALLSSHRRR